MRVYLPATVPLLRDWLAVGVATPVGLAFGVTPSLREWYREGDIDELEHAASLLAAVASLELLADDPSAPRRRVVLAADVDDAGVVPDLEERGALRLRDGVPSARWASALLDDDDAVPVVSGAVTLLRDASAGADDVDFALGEAEAADLGWYAVQELSDLLG
ncbi:MAG TPA: hypothetical protein VHW74_01270 [Mycobacteriales bacterium]|nr:hypothetical protein [Mycobacteriales bacterium]